MPPCGFRGTSSFSCCMFCDETSEITATLWLQVSDQLVEINGDSTAGMTHSQAVEMIRRGGQRIHLVLKRGNGYVPDYGKPEQIVTETYEAHDF